MFCLLPSDVDARRLTLAAIPCALRHARQENQPNKYNNTHMEKPTKNKVRTSIGVLH